ncbi:galactose mutarotase-like isoform X2 [Phymastichus coffea]|nr:galactose mutarotase-like isoform X2 [Phymastichus coffea]
MVDVILGFDNVNDYLQIRHIGRIVGCQLNCDDCAFDMVNWEAYILGEQVVMTHVSLEPEILTQVTYTWTDENRLHVDICAYATKCTQVDFGYHCFFNLAGHGMGAKELENHYVTVNAERWIEQDIKCNLPTGVLKKIHKTVYDLRYPTRLNAKKLRQVPGGGYNHNFCINNPSGEWCYRFHARMTHPNSGRSLEVLSNHPAMKFYTGNDLPDPNRILFRDIYNNDVSENRTTCFKKIIGKDGLPYRRHGCFALIPQGYPNASQFQHFPSNLLESGKIYVHNLTYDFGVDDLIV